MAYIKRIAIKTTLNNSINYIAKEKKGSGLSNEINYIIDKNKVAFTSGHNISANPDIAYKQMQKVKKQYNKTSGVLGHHYIQSFKPNEVTPEQAHQIAKEFVEKAFPNCMVIFSTHKDKNHIHNHFTVNSVLLNGKKFNSQTKTLYQAREISNEICLRHNLSIINKDPYYKSKKQFIDTKFNKDSLKLKYEILKYEIDSIILKSKSYDDFKLNLIKSGYGIKDKKYLSICNPKYKKFTRTKTLGAIYTKENIIKRIEDKEFNKSLNINLKNKESTIHLLGQLQSKTRAEKNQHLEEINDRLDYLNRFKLSNIDKDLKEFIKNINGLESSLNKLEQEIKVVNNLFSDVRFLRKNINKKETSLEENKRIDTTMLKLKQSNIPLNTAKLKNLEKELLQKSYNMNLKIQELESTKELLIKDLDTANKISKDKNDDELER